MNPMWFEIKANLYVASGSRRIFKTISLVKQQSEEVQKVVFPILQINANFTHPENILIATLTVENFNIRKLAWRRTKKNHSENLSKKVGDFKIPELIFECKNYHYIISWQTIDKTEPPAMTANSDPELDNHITANNLF